jgi:hypothetical protein
MKALALSIVMLAVTAAAQQAPAPPKAEPAPPAATPVEPKHSEASATLRALEAEKDSLYGKRAALVQQANQLIDGINGQIGEKDKAEADWIAKVKAENGWDDSYSYIPLAAQPDGTTVPGHWQHQPKK